MPRVALISGGTRGIGRAISLRLARAGFVPVMLHRADESAAAEALAQAKAIAPDAEVIRADLAELRGVEDAVSGVLARHGRIDVLVNNAYRGGRPPKKLHEIALEDWSADIAANLSGTFALTRACLPRMVQAKYGRIVFIGTLAMRGEPGRTAYLAAKCGMLGLMRAVSVEYARDGITSNMVSPGFIDAGVFARLDPAIKERSQKRVPIGRLGTAEEVAEAVLYFVSAEAGYTTGQILGVDGGVV
jgi:NAD(P)-dependent dehydrogenase (short-subunit alcohol dehydrogenase family)